eukprot:14501332-Heterocapsa_arctica.AAC.1
MPGQLFASRGDAPGAIDSRKPVGFPECGVPPMFLPTAPCESGIPEGELLEPLTWPAEVAGGGCAFAPSAGNRLT